MTDDEPIGDPTWAARHIMRNANAVPEWVDLRKDIDARTETLRRRITAHRQWLHDRTLLLAEIPAERIVEVSHATAARDRRLRAEITEALSELNGLVRRYDLLVIPSLQMPLVTLERLGLD